MGAGLHPKLETSVLLSLLQFATTDSSQLAVHLQPPESRSQSVLKLRLMPVLTLSVTHRTVGSDILTSSIALERRIQRPFLSKLACVRLCG